MAKIPEMTREQEAEFWKTHSSIDYLDDMEPVEVQFHPDIKSSRDLSRRCPVCDDVLLLRHLDRDTKDRQVTMHLRQFYCRKGHYEQLAPESEKLARAIEAVLDLRQIEPLPAEELVAA